MLPTGLFPASRTVACSGVANAVLAVALCGVPVVGVMLAGAPARLVTEKFAEVAPVALATTLYGPPAVAFAVNTADVATPLVVVVAVITPPAMPLLPPPPGADVATTPFTAGLVRTSVAEATNGDRDARLRLGE